MSKKRKNTPKRYEPNLNIDGLQDKISFVITILGFLGISAASIYNSVTQRWITNWWLVFLVFSISLSIIFILKLCKKYYRFITVRILNLFAKELPYKLQNWEICYEYLSPSEMQFEAHFDVIALQTGVDHIRVRYNWSGASEANPISPFPITDSGYQTTRIEADGTEFGYNFYKIYSNTKINVGDKPIKLGVKITDLKEREKKASPHLLTNINVQTERLVMKIILPYNILPENIEFLEYIHATDDYHWHKYVEDDDYNLVEVISTPDNKKLITWSIDSPIIGGKYVIRWRPKIITNNY